MDKKMLENLPYFLQQAYRHTDPERYAEVQWKVRARHELPEYLIGYLTATIRSIHDNLERYIEDLAKENK